MHDVSPDSPLGSEADDDGQSSDDGYDPERDAGLGLISPNVLNREGYYWSSAKKGRGKGGEYMDLDEALSIIQQEEEHVSLTPDSFVIQEESLVLIRFRTGRALLRKSWRSPTRGIRPIPFSGCTNARRPQRGTRTSRPAPREMIVKPGGFSDNRSARGLGTGRSRAMISRAGCRMTRRGRDGGRDGGRSGGGDSIFGCT